MSALAQLCYTIFQGATFREGFQWNNPLPYPTRMHCGKLVRADNGAPVPDSDLIPIDLTDCTARIQLRSEVLAPDVLLELTTENGGIDLSEGQGWVYFVIDAAASSAFPYGNEPPRTWSEAVSQLEVVHPNGDVTRVVDISWNLNPEGTR